MSFLFFWKQNIQILIFPNCLCVPFLIPLFSQLLLILMQTQYSLLRPLEVHPRLSGESLYHLLLLPVETGHGAGGGCGYWDGDCTLGLFRVHIPYKQLVIHDEKTGGKTVTQIIGQMNTTTPLTTNLLPLVLSNQIPSITLPVSVPQVH